MAVHELVKEVLNWLLEIAKIAIPAFVTVVTYRKMTAEQNPKLDQIEKHVNGDRAAKEARIRYLEERERLLESKLQAPGTPE